MVLGILCLVDGAALVLLTLGFNAKCLASSVVFQDTDNFGNATTEAEFALAWGVYGLRKTTLEAKSMPHKRP